MRKTLIVLPAAAGVAALVGTLAGGLPASGAGSATIFTLFEHQTEYNPVDNPPAGPSAGDMFTLASDFYTDTSQTSLVGHSGVACIQTSINRAQPAGEAECNWTIVLQDGQFTATGLVDLNAATTTGGTFTMPIVGGTGRYRNAQGQVAVKVLDANSGIFQDTFTLN